MLTIKIIPKNTLHTLIATFVLIISHTLLYADYDESNSLDQEIYKVTFKDVLEVSVYGEPDLEVTTLVDRKGVARFKLIGDIVVEGLTTREIEELLENEYTKQRFLRRPQLSVKVVSYVTREVMVLGQVVNPGPFPFPDGVKRIGIVELISRIGGFTGIARENKVTVTRYIEDDGRTIQRKFTVDVDALMSAYSNQDGGRKRFWIYPNDIVFVPESVF